VSLNGVVGKHTFETDELPLNGAIRISPTPGRISIRIDTNTSVTVGIWSSS